MKINNKATIKGVAFKTYKFDTQIVMKSMKEELISKGVKFVIEKLTPEKLPLLEQEVIFNCSGLGAI